MDASPAPAVLALTGPAVLLNVPKGQKRPSAFGWQKLALEDMTPDYLDKLRANIGVSLGSASDGLHSIDCDDDDYFAEMGRLNPRFADSLQSRGARGGNYWVRIEGDFPKSGKLKLRNTGEAVGEWRSTGNQTIIHGTHPSGIEYRTNCKPAITLKFSEITWPDWWRLPWTDHEKKPANTAPVQAPALHETNPVGHESSGITKDGLFVPVSDADRAKAFVARWQDEIFYVTDRGIWLTWEQAWRKDTKGGITRRAITLADETLARVASSPATSTAEIKQKSVALRQCSDLAMASSIRAMRSLAESFQEIQVEAKDLDADPWILGTPNAVIDLRTGEAFTHSPSNLVTMFTKAEFRADATAPRWEKFIEEIFPDEELRWYAWKAFGYAITGSTREKCFHFLIGTGDNGKSKLLECLSSILGDYSGSANKGLLYSNDRGSYPLREAASIVGKRFLVGPETEERDKLNTGLLKRLTGDGDTLDAANLYENQFSFVPCSKLFVMGNHRPGIADTGPAMWRRVRLIPFERVFTPAEQDRSLADKLAAESSGILNWLIRGALLWQREGLTPPAKVTAAVEDYRTDQDTLADFIDECTTQGRHGEVPHALLFKTYEAWAENSGIRFKLSKKGLAKNLRAKGWRDHATSKSKAVWQGVTLNQ